MEAPAPRPVPRVGRDGSVTLPVKRRGFPYLVFNLRYNAENLEAVTEAATYILDYFAELKRSWNGACDRLP